MRVFLGMILGAIITVTGAYVYDVISGRAANTSQVAPNATVDDRPIVNWDVVTKRWQSLETNVREMGQRVQEQWNKKSG